jgi:membrane fusion protein, multidrug efflux system
MTKIFNLFAGMKMLFSLAFLTILVSCGQNPTGKAPKKEAIKADTVSVFTLKMDSVEKIISLPGDLLPNEGIQIRAKVQGYIAEIKVDIGSVVRRGQVLALVDAPDLLAKERAAESRYLSSKDYYDRIYAASKTDGVIAPSELEKARDQMQSDEAVFKAAKFDESSYKLVDKYFAILAPFDGVITKRNVNAGSFVGNPNEKPLFEIEDARLMRLYVNVPEVYTSAKLADETAEVITRSLPDRKFSAKLVRKAGNIDINSRSEQWEFEIQNQNNELKSGSYADVKLRLMRPQPSFVVPNSAVVTTLEKKFVIKTDKNVTQWVDVRTGFTMGEKQEIFGELKPGDTIVLKGNEELKADKKVIYRIAGK